VKYAFEDRRVVCKGDYWIAPDAVVIGSVVLEPNASIWFGCIVRGDNDTITIGENSQLQDGCVLHADPGIPISIGKNVSVGHMAMLHGCTIGDGTLVIGSPGKVVRNLSAEEIQQIHSASDHYVQKFRRYRETFRADGA